MRTLALALALVLTGCATDVPVVEEATVVGDRWQRLPDWDTTSRLHSPLSREHLVALARANPNSAISQRRLLQLAAQEEDVAGLVEALKRMTDLGLALSPAGYESVGERAGEDVVRPFARRAEAMRDPVTASMIRSRIPIEVPLSETFVIDEQSGRMFTGSIVERTLYVSDDGQDWERVPTRSLGSVAGLAIDPATKTLWIASGRLDQTRQPETAFVGLIALDLDTLQEKRRITAPSNVTTVGDIALAGDGSVIVSDPLGSGVYRLGPGRGQLETLIEPRHLASPQGIVVHPSGHFAYVADWAYGVALVDLETRSLKRLDAPADVALDGVDGMAWHDGALIVIQNGLNPHRIVRWELSEDGYSVISATILERAHPDWGEPTVGQFTAERFHYISDPQWDRFAKGGVLKGDEPLRPNPVRVIELRK